MSRLTRDGTAEPVSRDEILRREPGQGNIHFPCSADHEQDRQPCPDDYTHTYNIYILLILHTQAESGAYSSGDSSRFPYHIGEKLAVVTVHCTLYTIHYTLH